MACAFSRGTDLSKNLRRGGNLSLREKIIQKQLGTITTGCQDYTGGFTGPMNVSLRIPIKYLSKSLRIPAPPPEFLSGDKALGC